MTLRERYRRWRAERYYRGFYNRWIFYRLGRRNTLTDVGRIRKTAEDCSLADTILKFYLPVDWRPRP